MIEEDNDNEVDKKQSCRTEIKFINMNGKEEFGQTIPGNWDKNDILNH